MLKIRSHRIMGAFYVFAGIYHFMNPDFYYPLIPDYLPFPTLINYLSGSVEIMFGTLVFIPKYRRWACYGIIVLLIAFIPSHTYFIRVGSCAGDLCVHPVIAWARLIVIHPLLIYWAWSVAKKSTKAYTHFSDNSKNIPQ